MATPAIKRGSSGPAGGPVDAVRYQAEKGVWILDVFDRLGIPRPVNVQGGPVGEAERRSDRAAIEEERHSDGMDRARTGSGSSSAAAATSRRPSGRRPSSTSSGWTPRSG